MRKQALRGWGVDDHNVSPEEVTKRLEKLIKRGAPSRAKKKIKAKPKQI